MALRENEALLGLSLFTVIKVGSCQYDDRQTLNWKEKKSCLKKSRRDARTSLAAVQSRIIRNSAVSPVAMLGKKEVEIACECGHKECPLT